MTGESWRYPEVKAKNREFWVPQSCYLNTYHIYYEDAYAYEKKHGMILFHLDYSKDKLNNISA